MYHRRVNGFELYLLGRRLMKIGEDALPSDAGFHRVPASARSVLADVFAHPGSTIGEIAARTGFPQSHVSASVAKFREAGALATAPDPADRRRTLVTLAERARTHHGQPEPAPIGPTLAAALGTDDPAVAAEAVSALETLGRLLAPRP